MPLASIFPAVPTTKVLVRGLETCPWPASFRPSRPQKCWSDVCSQASGQHFVRFNPRLSPRPDYGRGLELMMIALIGISRREVL
jgi:hypothetical protein